MSDDLRKMDDLLEKQNGRYSVNKNTTYSGHAFSILWKIQSYVYNYYFFFKENNLPIDKFSNPKIFFKNYIKAILSTYSPATESSPYSKSLEPLEVLFTLPKSAPKAGKSGLNLFLCDN